MSSSELPGHKAQSSLIAEAVSQTLAENSSATLATLIEAVGIPQANLGSKLLVREATTTAGTLGHAELDRVVVAQAARFIESRADTRVLQVKEFASELTDWSEAKILFERIQAESRLVICGAGHVGASLAKLASMMGYRATLIDDRAEFVTRENFPEKNIELVAAGNWSEAVRLAVDKGQGVSVAIVTRGHSEDEQCLRAVISVEVDYIGLIGSKRRTNIVLQRLRESGAAVERLEKVHAPVGLHIGAVTPEEVALAIMAEVVMVRRSGSGRSLSAWRRE
ncbi:MAG TPA: XdhC/CoxI family protein [Pyrinomonadaceae bacterium]|jgi:xanthine dehydrogenase accessory factor|nr:XdhC/CoxI family protein [Pyrinomonadaceae bacterium]